MDSSSSSRRLDLAGLFPFQDHLNLEPMVLVVNIIDIRVEVIMSRGHLSTLMVQPLHRVQENPTNLIKIIRVQEVVDFQVNIQRK